MPSPANIISILLYAPWIHYNPDMKEIHKIALLGVFARSTVESTMYHSHTNYMGVGYLRMT